MSINNLCAHDAEGHLVSVTGPSLTATFTYDGDGKRVKSTINGTSTYFVGGYYEVTGSTITKYYYAGSQRVAMREGGTLYYLLTDHLGSTSITTNASGNVVSELRYSAWGGVRYSSGSTATEYTFTGHYAESALGLMDFVARRYDPAIGRFISADSIVPLASQGVQAWDHYAYANNDPVRYTDPSGHGVDCGVGESGCKNTPIYRKTTVASKKSPENFAWYSNSLLSEGTIYARTWVIPESQAKGVLLSSKAEESYTGNLPIADMPYWYDLSYAVASTSSDFYNRFDRYPINAEINWQMRETGLIINDLEIKNYSPTSVGIPNVKFSTNIDYTNLLGPQVIVGMNGSGPGIIEMNLNFMPSIYLNTMMNIRFISVGGFPHNPGITLLLPPATAPPAGCSYPK